MASRGTVVEEGSERRSCRLTRPERVREVSVRPVEERHRCPETEPLFPFSSATRPGQVPGRACLHRSRKMGLRRFRLRSWAKTRANFNAIPNGCRGVD